MKRQTPKIIELDAEELAKFRERADAEQFTSEDFQTTTTLLDAYLQLLELVKGKNVSLARLRKILFGASTEKTAAVLGTDTNASPPPDEDEHTESTSGDDQGKGNKGHGRNGADAYEGAEKIQVPHETLQAGDSCPECQKGTVYNMTPGVLIRVVGQAPLQATVYKLQKLRCNLCGKVFTAQAPQGAGSRKYDATTGSMIALLKYGSGLPFNRLRRLQGTLGIPLPAATQWDVVHAKAKRIKPAFKELIRQAAQGDVIYNDDTNNKILEFMGKRAEKAALEEDSLESDADKKDSQRTGMFTTGIVSAFEGRQIALFFTGRKHAGENLLDLLAQRAEELERPIQMCDALSRNMPAELQTILANCLAHARRNFADVANYFSQECGYVLRALKVIYKNDAEARKQNLSPEERLQFHQAHSRSTMDELHQWLTRQIEERRVEPNSVLGEAISYMLNHWNKLTLFLHKAGAPLDNNICERALKKVIVHRKNSYFYKTQNGADVSDLYMSLIYTCELNGVNSFDYMTELERHADEVASQPESWTPWNYRITLDGLIASSPSPAVPIDLLPAGHVAGPASP